MACIYDTHGTCLHPDKYGKPCKEGGCPIPRRKDKTLCNVRTLDE